MTTSPSSISDAAVHAALNVLPYQAADYVDMDYMRFALEAAAPYMLAGILEDVANTAETDELTTAAEVIYDLRRHAKDLRPTG